MTQNLATFLRDAAPSPAKTLISNADGREVTYADFWAMAAQFAHGLALAGVAPGDRVAVQVEKSVEALALILGCLRMGGVILPLNSGYTPREVAFFLGDAEPALLVCDPGSANDLAPFSAGAGARIETLDGCGAGSLADLAAGQGGEFDDHVAGADDLAAILYTSGTTGRSKGAMLTHGNLRSNAETLVKLWRFTDSDVLLHALPIFHTHGLFVATNVVLASGGSMIFLPNFDAGEVVRLLPRATAMMGVPTFYTRLLAEPEFDAARASGIRVFISGSAPLSAEVHREFSARTGHAILERYGMTETNMNTSNPYDAMRRPGTVGLALPDVDVRIVHAGSGEEVVQGQVGIIEVKGPNVFKGYWRNPDKTAEAFRADGYFITGDMARRDEDGFIHIVGRDKDLIITGGFNVYPAEVEALLDEVEGIAESAIIGVPHPDFGEGVTAVVAAKPGASLDAAAILTALIGRLAAFKRPKRVIIVDALPRNAMGKIQKADLRECYKALYSP